MDHREPDVALTVAGSDSGGGAGIQADLKTMEAFGVFGTSAITSLTAQNSTGVRGVEDVSSDFVAEQIDAVVEDFDVGAVKTGMLSSAETARVVAEKIDEHELRAVVDPVMIAQSGDRLLSEDAEEVVRDELLPRAALVTPNAPEAATLTDHAVESPEEMAQAARALVEQGAEAALVTGGHIEGDRVVDVLADEEGTHRFEKARVETGATHGTGCALSSAVAAELAKGASLGDAVGTAEAFLYRAVRFGIDAGEGANSAHHHVGIRNEAARNDALDAVRDALARFEEAEADVSRLLPEVGTNVGVATPYALEQDEVAAVEGRVRRTRDGFVSSCVRFGASGHVARYLLELREHVDAGAACNLRNDAGVRGALEETDLRTVEIDRSGQPEEVREGEGGTMEWSARAAVERADFPDAVVDAGAVGKEPMVRLAARDADELVERVLQIAEHVDDSTDG